MISVIVPVYNSSPYLENCLESIITQTNTNIEILVIDDGSTDNSWEICKKYADRDKRVKIFKKENGGQSSARNLGLDIAAGTYISFIDSDDSISPDLFEKVEEAFKSDEEIEIVQFPIFMNYGLKSQYINVKKGQKIVGSENVMKGWLVDNSISWIVCNKVFTKKVFSNLRFEDMYYEDNYMVALVLERFQNLKIIEEGIYYYYYREHSTTTSMLSFEKERDTQKVNYKIYDMLKGTELYERRIKQQMRIINAALSLYRTYKKELLLFPKTEISIKNLIGSKISLLQKIKLLIYRVCGKPGLQVFNMKSVLKRKIFKYDE